MPSRRAPTTTEIDAQIRHSCASQSRRATLSCGGMAHLGCARVHRRPTTARAPQRARRQLIRRCFQLGRESSAAGAQPGQRRRDDDQQRRHGRRGPVPGRQQVAESAGPHLSKQQQDMCPHTRPGFSRPSRKTVSENWGSGLSGRIPASGIAMARYLSSGQRVR